MCHPDRVAEEFKAQATRQFQALNDAYKQNDLATVEKILDSLQSDEVYQLIESLANDADYNAFFDEREQQLKAELQRLQEALRDD